MHWFIDPITNHYADFQGRAGRLEFWMFMLVSVLLSIIIGMVEDVTGNTFAGFLFLLAILLPTLAIGSRRLHDINMSGWWQMLGLVQFTGIGFVHFIGIVILIVLFASKSKDKGNRYGVSTVASAGVVPVPQPGVSADVPVPEASAPEPTLAEPKSRLW